MAAPAQHPAFPRDAWPSVELKRMPNREMGVVLEFPAPPELRPSFDVLVFLIEPQRALTLRKNLDDVLETMGIADKNFERAAVSAVVSSVGGTVEGHPVSSINYLQRVRWLARLEAEVKKLDVGIQEALYAEMGDPP